MTAILFVVGVGLALTLAMIALGWADEVDHPGQHICPGPGRYPRPPLY